MTKVKPRLIARISCQECRRRKTRCNFDGQSQKCLTCARIGTPCIFSQKNGVVLDMDKVIEENHPHLIHQREKEQRSKEREQRPNQSAAQSSTSFVVSRSNTLTDMHENGRSSPTDELTGVLDRLQIDAFGIAPHTLRSFSQVAGDNDSAEQSSSDADPVPTSRSSSIRRKNSSVGHADKNGSQDNEAATDAYGPTAQPQDRPSTSTHASSASSSARPRLDNMQVIQYDLINLYFEHVHPYFLLLHKPSFLRRLNDPKDPVPDYVLAAMYALAAQYSPTRAADGRKYFKYWLSKLDETLDKPRLSTIQALLMIIKYQEGVKHPGFYFRTYMYTQMVIVLARELQLHKTTPVNMKLDPESHETRRRLFWAVFLLDQFISVSQGRAMSFREVEPEADMPKIDNEDPNDPHEIEVILNHVEAIKLAKINHQSLILVRKFLTKVVTPHEAIPQGQMLLQSLQKWRSELPPRLQLNATMTPLDPGVALLHTLYHACNIMIQRCYCEDSSICHLEIAATSMEECIVSSTTITILFDGLYSTYGMRPLTYPVRGCYFSIYCLIASATIQAGHVRRGTNGPIMFKRSLALLNMILRESTAVDIEREIELLKTSVDVSMESRSESYSPPPMEQQRKLKPILPMSQRYGNKAGGYGSPGAGAVRVRKISPKGAMSTSPKSQKRDSAEYSSPSGGGPGSAQPYNFGGLSADGTSGASKSPSVSNSINNTGGTCEIVSTGSQRDEAGASSDDEQGAKPRDFHDLKEPKIEPGTNRHTGSNSISSATLFGAIPTFTTPNALPNDFKSFIQEQQRLLSVNQINGANGVGHINGANLDLSQFIALQQAQQQQSQQQYSFQSLLQVQNPNSPQAAAHPPQSQSPNDAPLVSINQLSLGQLEDLQRMNQLEVFQRQQQQQQQQSQQVQQPHQNQQQQQQQQNHHHHHQSSADFSSMNDYQNLDTDRAQSELMSLLNSSMFNSFGGDGITGVMSIMPFNQMYQQQQALQHGDRTGNGSPHPDKQQQGGHQRHVSIPSMSSPQSMSTSSGGGFSPGPFGDLQSSPTWAN